MSRVRFLRGKIGVKKIIPILVIAIVLIVLPVITHNEPFILHLVTIAGIYCILCASLRLIFTANVWFVGPSAFYALGAFGVTLLMKNAGISSYWLCIPLVCLGVVIIATAFGYVVLRVRAMYFAILSLAFVEVVRLAFVNTLGTRHVLKVPLPNAISIPHLFTIDFASAVDFYYVSLALVAVTLVILYTIERHPFGITLKAIAASEPLSESIGIKTLRYKVLALSICALFMGIAGCFFAPYHGTISPDTFSVATSMKVLIMAIVGGMGSPWGPVIGATILVLLPEYLPVGPLMQKVIYGALAIVTLYFLPEGLVSLPRVIRNGFKSKLWGFERKVEEEVNV